MKVGWNCQLDRCLSPNRVEYKLWRSRVCDGVGNIAGREKHIMGLDFDVTV
jgi:hypothetical protein